MVYYVLAMQCFSTVAGHAQGDEWLEVAPVSGRLHDRARLRRDIHRLPGRNGDGDRRRMMDWQQPVSLGGCRLHGIFLRTARDPPAKKIALPGLRLGLRLRKREGWKMEDGN